jgi:hypothetical protein
MNGGMNTFWGKGFFLLLVITLCVGFVRLTTQQTDNEKGADSDGRNYITMAGDTLFPASFKSLAPFCYRVATPWIASKLPGATVMAKFRLVALLDSILMLLLVFAWLRAMQFSYSSALIGIVFYATVFWSLKFSFFAPAYIDHMTQVLALLLLWVMARGWWYLLPPLLFGAFFQKEALIFLVPTIMVYYLHEKGWKWWPLYVLGIFLLAASVIPYFILRNNVHQTNSSSTPFHAISDAFYIATKVPGYSRIMFVAIFSGLGIMPLILLSHFRWLLDYLKARPYWVVMLACSLFLLFGGADKPRLMLYMLPLITLLAVAVVDDFRRWMPKRTFWVWLAIILLLQAYVGNLLTPFPDFGSYLDLMVPEHSGNQGAEGYSRSTYVLIAFLVVNFIMVRPLLIRRTLENQS